MEMKQILSRGAELTCLQKFPFPIKRIYFIKGISYNDTRGKHKHKKTRQLITCVSGNCILQLNKSQTKQLNEYNYHLLEPNDYHEIFDFTKDCILLVLCSEEYNESDYIR